MGSQARLNKGMRRKDRVSFELSRRTKITIIAALSGVVVCVGGAWLFYQFTTIPKPDLLKAEPTQVAEYLGDSRGFSRLAIPQREQFLVEVIKKCDTPEKVERMSQALRKLSFSQQQELLDASFDIGKERFLEASAKYAQTPKNQKKAFVDNMLDQFGNMRTQIGGQDFSNPNNLANPFKDHIPTKSDQWTKMILSRTSPSERSKAKPLVDDITNRAEEMKRTRKGS